MFYAVFTPITIYAVYFILDVFFEVMLIDSIIVFNGFSVEIIKACVAGSAYYLLLALNLAIPKIDIKKRLKMIGFAFACLLAFNLLRIIVLALVLYYTGNLAVFDIMHKAFWFSINILVVVGIWFIEVWLFKLKQNQIPVYSDFKALYKKSVFSK